MSHTPETDKASFLAETGGSGSSRVVLFEFSQKLEVQRDEAIKLRDELAEEIAEHSKCLSKARDVVEAQDAEIKRLNEAILWMSDVHAANADSLPKSASKRARERLASICAQCSRIKISDRNQPNP